MDKLKIVFVKKKMFDIFSHVLKIFFPLKDEPLSLKDFREILAIKAKEREFWLKHKKTLPVIQALKK